MKHLETFQAWLDAAELSDKEAARVLETSAVTVWRIRTGRQWPSRELAQKIVTASDGAVSLGGIAFGPSKDAA